MLENTNENITQEEIEKRKKNFESLKNFLISDMKLKQTLLKLAPNERDDYNEESRIQYTDRVYKELRNIEMEFLDIIKSFDFSQEISDTMKNYFDKARESFLLSHYEQGTIEKLYREQFSNMSKSLVELTKEKCIGYTYRANLSELINSSNSINELLHVMHSYIMNSESILQQMPIIDVDNERYYPITLYGEENEISKKIFNEFPKDSNSGWTDIISTQNKILMMIRDKGHALTIDIDISKEEEIFIKYFVPKLCNVEMIKALPGVNLSSITQNGATGAFVTTKKDLSKSLFGFIEKVPTDADMPPYIPMQEVSYSEEESSYVFEEESAKELAMEQGENGRRTGALVDFQKN